MAAGLEPGRQTRLGISEPGVRDADLVELTPSPRLDVRGKARQASLTAERLSCTKLTPGMMAARQHGCLADEDATLAAGALLAAAL